jgi:hypothetical protein
MAFLDRSKVVEENIARAEAELNEALNMERPVEAGAALPKQEGEVLPKGNVPEVVDGVNWKERYANLQRWQEKVLKAKHKEEIDALTNQVKTLSSQVKEMISKASPTNLPSTIAEVEKLKSENPAAYAAIMKVASDVASQLVEEQISGMRQDVEEIKRVKKESAEEAAFVQLQKRFPDIDILGLEDNAEFQSWISKKSKRMQDALFSNKEDVDAAAEVLDLYTLQVIDKKPATPGRKQPAPGSDFVAPKSGMPSIPGQDLGFDFTESQIEEEDKKNPRWFERNQDKIEAAIAKGRVLRDISDPIGSQRRLAAMGVG